MKNEEYLEEIFELVEDALDNDPRYIPTADSPTEPYYDITTTQPKHSSWVHFFWSYGGLANEFPTAINYANAQEFQDELVKKIRLVFTPQTLEYVRQAKITEFGMHIGPYQPSGGSLNDELGIEVDPEMHDRNQD